MDSDVIGIIKGAEAKCADAYNSALDKTKEAVRDAKTKAKADAEAKIAAFNEQCQKRLEAAADSAKKEAQSITDGNKLQCDALKDVANQNMQKSVDYILGRIVS